MNDSTRKNPQMEPFVMVPISLLESELSSRAMLVMIALLSYRNNRDNVVWPSYDAIKRRCGLSGTATIRSAITELERAGLIECERRFSGSTRYILQNLKDSPSISEVSVLQILKDSPSESEIPVLQIPKDSSSISEGQSFKNENLTISTEQDKLNKKKNSRATRSTHPLYNDLFVKIAEVCNMDKSLPRNAKQCADAAKYLSVKDVTPDILDVYMAWHWTNHWKGMKGQLPIPGDITSSWQEFSDPKSHTTKSNSPAAPKSPQAHYGQQQSSNGKTHRKAQVYFTDEQKRKAEEDARRMLAKMEADDAF